MDDPSDDKVPTLQDTIARAVIEAGVAATPWYVQAIAAPMRVILEDTQRRRAARLETSVIEIAEGVGGPDVLAAALSGTENEVQFVQAMDAAVRSGMEAKRKLLVRAVVNSLTDTARFDESQMIIDALAELNTMHVRALALLADELDEEGAWKVPLRLLPTGHVHPADVERGNGRSKVWEDLPAPVKATLLRSGACRAASGLGMLAPSFSPRPTDGINDFGRLLLQQLRAEAEESPIG